MIKVLFLIQALPLAGTEAALYNLLAGIDETQFHVTVYTYYAGGSFEDSFVKLFQKKGFCLKHMFHSLQPGKTPWSKLKNYYLLHIVEPQKFRHPGRFYRAALEGTYDIEVAFTFFGTPLIIAASPNSASKKVAWIHGDMSANPWCTKYYRNTQEQAANYKQFHKVICVSETVKQAYIQVLGDTNNLQVLHNPIDTERIRQLALSPLPDNMILPHVPTVCAVGRLSPEKGYNRLIRIHRQLLDEGILHHLLLVGDGEERSTLENLIDELQVRNSVQITGYDTNPYRYIANSHFLVCSSFTEGLPVVAQEALVLGKPVVSSHPSVLELFAGKECGIVSGVEDDSLRDALRNMLTDQALWGRCQKNAREVGSQIQLRTMVEAAENMFVSLLEK